MTSFFAKNETRESVSARNVLKCLSLLSYTDIFLHLFTYFVFCKTFSVRLGELMYSVAFITEETYEAGTRPHVLHLTFMSVYHRRKGGRG